MVNRVSLEPLQQALSKDVTILVPNNRLRDALIGSYTETQKKAVFSSPPIISIDVWIRSLWEELVYQGLSPLPIGYQFLHPKNLSFDKHNRERTI